MKNTIIEKICAECGGLGRLKSFAHIIRDGGTVIFPTETVYGLGANALDEGAAVKIYSAKGRPSDNPLIVHISEIDQIYDIACEVSDKARVLMDEFWPGPVTFVFKKKECVPYATTGGLDTVAVRLPSHPTARELIRLSGVPIAGPSANISGRPSPTREEHVISEMDGRVDGIILGGACDVGLESTVVDMTKEVPVVLRPGGITLEQLENAVGRVDVDPAISGPCEDIAPMSPGMKYKHYAPDAQVYIVSGEREAVIKRINGLCRQNSSGGITTGVICMDQNAHLYEGCEVASLGRNMNEAASLLFDVLIEMDNRGAEIVYSESFDESGMGRAVMNRLLKSAGYRIINA